MRQKRGIGMFKDPDTLVLKGFFCKSGHCTLIVEVKSLGIAKIRRETVKLLLKMAISTCAVRKTQLLGI